MVVQETETSWSLLQKAITDEWNSTTDRARSPFLERLRRFGAPVATPDAAEIALSRIGRGFTQLNTSVNWTTPIVGGDGQAATPIQQDRGWQWRHVIAFSGFEIFLRGVVAADNGIHPEHYEVFVENANELADPKLPSPPDQDRAELARWLRGEAQQDIVGFFGAQAGLAALLKRFLVDGSELEGWTELLRLAAVLRHASAHGSLSPTKARRWGLIPILKDLPTELNVVVDAAVQTLARPATNTGES